jgi:hypothetical protein
VLRGRCGGLRDNLGVIEAGGFSEVHKVLKVTKVEMLDKKHNQVAFFSITLKGLASVIYMEVDFCTQARTTFCGLDQRRNRK